MKDNTKIRLHLSKQLFESLTKQVIAEAKSDMSGGAYTEAVKQPKAKHDKGHKEDKVEEKTAPTPAPKAVGASKQQVAAANIERGTRLRNNPAANIQSSEGGILNRLVDKLHDIVDDKDNAAVILTQIEKRADQLIKAPKKPVAEMETEVAEEPIKEVDPLVVGPALAFLGSAAAVVVSLLKDLKQAKTPEEKQKIFQDLSDTIQRSRGA